MTAPRVGVNLLWMEPEVVGGSEEYSTRLLSSVAGIGRHRLVLFVRGDFSAHHEDLAAVTETVVAPLSGSSRVLRVALENSWLPHAARRVGVQLVHHLGGTVPWRNPTPTVLTLHDLQPLVFPENFSALKRGYLRRAIPRSVVTADAVSTTSGYVARAVASRFGLPVRDIAVVHAGPGPVEAHPGAAAIRSMRERYGIGDRYAIYPAVAYPHKNHEVLVQAAASFEGVQLVFTGGPGPADQEIADRIAADGLTAQVKRLGRVPVEDLRCLLWGAAMLLFPSRYEGFGLPVVEAMARGVPVVAANATCLPELVADAGLIVEPSNPSDWAAAVRRLESDTGLAAELAERGRIRVAEFASESGGERLASLYDRVLAHGEQPPPADGEASRR